MNIIDKLNNAYKVNPDPDFVATCLRNGGWVRVSEMSREYFEENKNQTFKLGYVRKGIWAPLLNVYTLSKWYLNYEYFIQGMAAYDYWIALKSEPSSCPPSFNV